MNRFIARLALAFAGLAICAGVAWADSPAECADQLACCDGEACQAILADCVNAELSADELAQRMRRIAKALAEHDGICEDADDGGQWDIDRGDGSA